MRKKEFMLSFIYCSLQLNKNMKFLRARMKNVIYVTSFHFTGGVLSKNIP